MYEGVFTVFIYLLYKEYLCVDVGLCWLCFRFEHVPLVTPNGDILVDDLSFEVTILDGLMSVFK